MKNVLELIKERRSIRKYKTEMPSKEMLTTLLQAGNFAPSDGNSQPWEFVVTQGEYAKKTCEVFYQHALSHIPNAPYIPAEKKPMMLDYAKDFGGAPCHIVVTQPKFDNKFKQDDAMKACAASVQNILLQAHSMDLGAVWICLPDSELDKVNNILGIADDRLITAIIPVGYPDMKPIAPPRADADLTQKAQWLGF